MSGVNTEPLVSIVIPVYNGANYVGAAIDSALAQSYPNIEVLVINDGSKDDGRTAAVVKTYGDRVRYFEKENGGVSTALNRGIREMKGQYFSWLSHDDAYLPEKVARQVAFINEHNLPEAITYTDFECINDVSEVTGVVHARPVHPDAFKVEFILGGILHGCSLLIPKVCFDRCGIFDETLRATQDFELWFRFSEAGFRFLHIPETLVKWRLHEQQVSVQRKALCDAECNVMYRSFLRKIGKPEIRRLFKTSEVDYYLRYANKMMDYGYYKAARLAISLSAFNVAILKPRRSIGWLRAAKRLFQS